MREAHFERAKRSLREGEAHVWRVALSELSDGGEVTECLSVEERERVKRQQSADARRRFIATRSALRHILASYTGEAAAALVLVVDARGKPALAGERRLHFSLSHSGSLVVIGVARAEVGVDVERVREPRRLLITARRVLHEETVRALEAMDDERRRTAFLDAWTQRESHVKAVGGGLFLTPDVLPFDAAQQADGEPRAYRERNGGREWTVVRFTPDGAARASLVARGRLTRVSYFDWNANDVRGEVDDD